MFKDGEMEPQRHVILSLCSQLASMGEDCSMVGESLVGLPGPTCYTEGFLIWSKPLLSFLIPIELYGNKNVTVLRKHSGVKER